MVWLFGKISITIKITKNNIITVLLLTASFFAINISNAQCPDIPYHPNPYNGGCLVNPIHDHATESKIVDNLVSETLYEIRDKFLDTNPRGKKYINQYYYYYASDIVGKNISKVSITTLYDITKLMPKIYAAYNNMKDSKYTGVIVNKDLKENLISVLTSLRQISNDGNYDCIMGGLIDDATSVESKTKGQVLDFMKNID